MLEDVSEAAARVPEHEDPGLVLVRNLVIRAAVVDLNWCREA